MIQDEYKTLQENIAVIQDRIDRAARSSGRSLKDIVLVAATKMNSAERVQAAISCGIHVVGENRVQELLEKYDMKAYQGASLHFIGTLQSNKVKYLIGKTDLIQSVDSIKLGQTISKEAVKYNVCQSILLEVNIGQEPTKSGLHPDFLVSALEILSELPGIRIRGLMAIPPISHVQGENLCYFERMNQLFVDISSKRYDNVSMDFLSMGMTGDFEDAIACGANMIRIGTAIFGRRPYAL